MVRKPEIKFVEHLGGGEGIAEVHHIVPADELGGAGRLYAQITLPPHTSVGWHQHRGETEPYYILSGHGVFLDNDGSRNEVGPGDVCAIRDGEFHGLENPSDDMPLTFIALIYNLL